MTVSDSVTELDELLLLETEGETALALSVKHHRPVVVYDLCASDTVVLAAAATNAPAATDKAVLFPAAGQESAAHRRLSRPAGVAHGGDAD
jgi:hypothetical protein